MSLEELKAGDTTELRINGHILVIEPIPFGRLKKLSSIVMDAMNVISKMDSDKVMTFIWDLIEKRLTEVCLLIFDKTKHPFMDQEWIENNLSAVHMREIVEKGMIVNGLQDFFGKKAGKAAQALPVVETTGTR